MSTPIHRALRRWLLPSLCSLSVAVAGSSSASAIEYTWKAGSGNWATPSRWSPLFGPPNAGDSAVIMNELDESYYQATLGADVLGSKSPNQLSIGRYGRVVTNGHRMVVAGSTYLFNEGSQLYVNGVSGDDSAWGFESDSLDVSADGMLRLNDGRIRASEVTLRNGSMLINGQSRLQASTQIFVGDNLGNFDASVTVGVGATGTLVGPVRFQSDADVTIGSQGELRMANNTTFAGGRYQGQGLLQLDGATTVIANHTTIDMPSGRVDLDGTEDILAAGQSLVVNANFTINALMLDEGNNTFGTSRLIGKDVIQINQWGKLGVNLTNDNTAWTMNGHLDIKAVTGQVISHNLSGSPMFLKGTASVQGNSAWSAQTEVAGSIQIAADSHLRFSGGNLESPNRMSGGSIQGPGTLGSLDNQKLLGYGTIDTKIKFLGNSELRAENGTLTLGPSSELLALGIIGTESNSGILEVQHEWNTNVASTALELKGGKVTGAKLINGNRTRGFGRINSESFVNRGVLEARGISMYIDTVDAPDLDGDNELATGSIEVLHGNLVVTKAPKDPFNGKISVGAAHWATFAEGWRLDRASFLPTGVLDLNGSHVHLGAAVVAGGLQKLAGVVNVDQVGAFHAPTEFLPKVAVNLPNAMDWLQLFEPSSVWSGAGFSGQGQLQNMEGNSLLLKSGAHVQVELLNRGRLALEDTVEDAQLKQLSTTPTSVLELSVLGKEKTLYDTLFIDGKAQLAGTLVVDTQEAGSTYVDPMVRGAFDRFTLVDSSLRNGQFDQFHYDGQVLDPTFQIGNTVRHHVGHGLFRNLQYGSQNVTLTNYLAISGDANGDGSFDSTDFVFVFQAGEYEDAIAQNSGWTEGDWDGDGEFTSSDFVVAFQAGLYEQGSVLPAVRAIPEPTSSLLLTLGLLGLISSLGRRRRAV